MLAAATLVNTVGNGLFMTVSALFFTRSVGLPLAQVGLGLTLAGGAGLLVGIPVGRLADRRGPRGLLVGLTLLEAAVVAAYTLVQSFSGLLLVAALEVSLLSAANAVRTTLIASLLGPAGRVHTRAYLRAVSNVGISVGTVFAGVALHFDTRAAYLMVIAADAATFAVSGLMLLALPPVPPGPPESQAQRRVCRRPRFLALRDRPYMLLAALNGMLALHFGLLTVAVPLWVVGHTSAPKWTVALLYLVNTTACVLFQVRVARRSGDLLRAAGMQRRSGWLLAGGALLYGLAAGHRPWLAVALLVGAAGAHVAGELFQSAGSFGLSFGLAPDDAQGEYGGLYQLGLSVATMVGPVVSTGIAVGMGLAGWSLLAGLFVAAGAGIPPAARWALGTRAA